MEAFYFSSPQQQVSVCGGRASPLFVRAPLAGKGGLGQAACASEAGRRALPEQSPCTVVNRNLPF